MRCLLSHCRVLAFAKFYTQSFVEENVSLNKTNFLWHKVCFHLGPVWQSFFWAFWFAGSHTAFCVRLLCLRRSRPNAGWGRRILSSIADVRKPKQFGELQRVVLLPHVRHWRRWAWGVCQERSEGKRHPGACSSDRETKVIRGYKGLSP